MTTPEAALETELMYDSTDAWALPGGARYAAYVNGRYANYAQVRSRFVTARIFGIDVLGDSWETARIVDYEPGDVQGPAGVRRFVQNRNAYRPKSATVYCNRDELPEVEAACEGLWHVIWLATLDGTKMTGQRTERGNLIVATQFEGGLHAPFDTSEVLRTWR